MRGPYCEKNGKLGIDFFGKSAIIANVADATQINMDAEMAELVEGARLEIV